MPAPSEETPVHRTAVMRAVVLCLVLALAAALAAWWSHEARADNQETLLLAPAEWSPGAPAAVRVVVRGHRDLQPQAGARVAGRLLDSTGPQSWKLFSGVTDRSGALAGEFRVPALPAGPYRLQVVAESTLGSDRVIRPVLLRQRFRTLFSTDKPVYQPDQTIHMRALTLDAVGNHALESGQATFVVDDPKGNQVFKKSVEIREFGVSSADFVLAHEISLGGYQASVTIDGEQSGRVVSVQKYALPRFRVSFVPARREWLDSETVRGRIVGKYFFGKKVAGGRVRVDLTVVGEAEHHVARIDGTTAADGSYPFAIPPRMISVRRTSWPGTPPPRNRTLRFDVSLTDGAGHEERVTDTVAIVGKRAEADRPRRASRVLPIALDVVPERRELVAGIENVVYVTATLPGAPSARCDLTLEADGQLSRARTDALGIAEFRVKPVRSAVQLRVTARAGRQAFGTRNLELSADAAPAAIRVRVDRALYEVGQPVRVTVLSPLDRGFAFLDIARDSYPLASRTVVLHHGRGDAVLDLPAEAVGTLQIHASQFGGDGTASEDSCLAVVRPRHVLQVEARTERPEYRPGEPARLKVHVRDDAGRPVAAALGVSVVDESVHALAGDHPGLAAVYFLLREDLRAGVDRPGGADLPTLLRGRIANGDAQRALRVMLAAAAQVPGSGAMVDSYAQKLDGLRRRQRAWRGFETALAAAAVIAWMTGACGVDDAQRRRRLLAAAPLAIYAVALAVPHQSGEADAAAVAAGGALLLFGAWYPVALVAAGLVRWRGWAAAGTAAVGLGGALYLVGRAVDVFAPDPSVRALQLSAVAGAAALYAAFVARLVGRYGRSGVGAALLWTTTACSLWGAWSHADVAMGLGLVLLLLTLALAADVLADERQWLAVLTAVAALVLFALLAPNLPRARAQGQAAACRSNLRNIGAALERFSTDHSGSFPASLSELVPQYLKAIPTCPSAGRDTYSESYLHATSPDAYTVFCSGANHLGQGLAIDEPRYTATQGLIERGDDGSSGGLPTAPGLDRPHVESGPHLRAYFPETLLWNPLVITDAEGNATVEVPPADSITRWRAAVLASTRDGRVATAAAGLRVFQGFFVDPDVPAELTRGDAVTIPIAVYNYLSKPQSIRVTLADAGWLKVSGARQQVVRVGANDVASASFAVRARIVGDHRLVVRAHGADGEDAVSRPVRVAPDGRPVEVVYNGRLQGRAEREVDIPADSIPGSGTILVKAYPGLTAEILDGLDGMLHMPHGCFEQTTSITYPNVMVLQYLEASGRASSSLRERAERLIGAGYQRLLTFESPGGGFSWFGSDAPSEVLTAYGLLEFHDMATVFPVDDALVARTRAWLLGTQERDGAFPTDSSWHESKQISTAYVTWALLEAGERGAGVQKALRWLRACAPAADDVGAVALMANAFTLDPSTRDDARTLLARYHEPWRVAPGTRSRLAVQVAYDRTRVHVGDVVTVSAEISNGTREDAEMLVAELGAPPGFEVVTQDFDVMEGRRQIARYEQTPRAVVAYLPLVQGGRSVRLRWRMRARFPVRAVAPATTVYEYYDPSMRAEAPPQPTTVR